MFLRVNSLESEYAFFSRILGLDVPEADLAPLDIRNWPR